VIFTIKVRLLLQHFRKADEMGKIFMVPKAGFEPARPFDH
jgi:hypothetical protein